MYWKDLVNTYTPETLTYTLSQSETLEGPYTEIVSKTNVPKKNELLVDSLTIPVGKTYYYELVITLNYLEDVNQDADLNAIFSSTFRLEDINYIVPNLTNKIIVASNGVRTTFDSPATTDEGIFEMEDDYGTSYYYRGAVVNNYVKFGKNKSGQDMYWRIIRINGDGSLRIIYDGTSAHANGESNTDRIALSNIVWNKYAQDAKFLGYMYGGQNGVASTSKEQAQTNETDSSIKEQLDIWYKENVVDTGYGGAVSDEIFCNDRSTPGRTETGWKYDTALGYGIKYTAYGAIARLYNGLSSNALPNPSFICPEKNDAFTVLEKEKGNSSLTHPIGLITADEIVAAGLGKYGTSNSEYYLNKGLLYWTLSPYLMDNNNYADAFIIYPNGGLQYYTVHNSAGVAPVINLSAEYVNTLIGEGTIESPYRAK